MKKLHIEPITYFDKIDTEYKAYILGIIYADGTIDDKVKGKREYRLTISLQKEDKYILEKLMKDNTSREVRLSRPPSVEKNNWKTRAVASISNTYMCKKLIELGCPPRKSQIGMRFPEIPTNLIHHFIRGFFDGDGSVSIRNEKYVGKNKVSIYKSLRLAFTSTDYEFLDKLFSFLPVTKIYKRKKLRSIMVYTYWIERKLDIENVYKYLYSNSNFYLTRKYDKFNMLIKSEAKDKSLERLETT